MKVVERTIIREIDVSAEVVLWNYWDFEHITVIHKKNYKKYHLLHDSPDCTVFLLTYKVPWVPIFRVRSLGVVKMLTESKFVNYQLSLFKVPVTTTIDVIKINENKCKIETTYSFMVSGWKRYLAPLMYQIMKVWNDNIWEEDLPLKNRRHLALNYGFQNFSGIPAKSAYRYKGNASRFHIPFKRPGDSPVHLNKVTSVESVNSALYQ